MRVASSTVKTASSIKTQLPVLVVLALLAVLAFSSLMALLGDVNAEHAKQREQRWQQQPTALTLQQWQTAEAYLQRALQFSPAHPDYLQALGRMSSWYLLLNDELLLSGDERQAQTVRGLEYFREALTQRPYWAYGWAELALLKAQAQQVDDEFALAVRAALQQGPNERQVLSNLLNAGLSVWPQLTLVQQLEVHALFRRMLTLHWTARDAMKLVEFHGMKAGFCYGLADDADIPQWVKRSCPR